MQNLKLYVLFFSTIIFLLYPSVVSAQVVINEILPDPAGVDTENEWLELYNLSSSPQTIDGYIIEDKNGKRITLSGIVDKWQVIYPKGASGFALTNTGSTIKLYESTVSAQPLSEFTYVGSTKGKSWGRIPDGGEIYSEKFDPTPGGPNQIPSTPTPSPTSEPTAAPTSTPSPTPTQTKTSTPTPTKTPTPKPTPTPLQSNEVAATEESNLILGVAGETSPTPTASPSSSERKRPPVLAILLIAAGVGLLGFAGFSLIKSKKSGYTNNHEEIS